MTPDMLSAIAALIAALGSVVGVIVSLLNRGHIKEVKQNTNGLNKELTRVATIAARAEGFAAGQIAKEDDLK